MSGLPVVDKEGHLIGMVTEGDFLRRAETGTQRRRRRWLEFLVGPGRLADEYARSHGRKVSEVMTPDPVTVSERHPARGHRQADGEAADQARAGCRAGSTSSASSAAPICCMRSRASPARRSPLSRATKPFASGCIAELGKQPWAPVALIDPIVRNGVVELWGTITDERERQALVVAAENVPGVKAVRDHLAWVDATSGMVVYQSEDEPVEAKAS